MIRQLSTFSLLMWLLNCTAIYAEPLNPDRKRELTFGYIDFYPHYWTDENGQHRGHLFEFSKEIAESAGYKIRPYNLPVKRFIQMITSGELDFWIGLKNLGALQKHVLVSSLPVLYTTPTIYSKKPMDHFKGLEDLKGKTLVTINGYTYGGNIYLFINAPENKITQIKANDHFQSVRILFGRNTDYLISYKHTIEAINRTQKFPQLFGHPLITIPSFISLNRQLPDAEKIMKIMEAEARKILAKQSLKNEQL